MVDNVLTGQQLHVFWFFLMRILFLLSQLHQYILPDKCPQVSVLSTMTRYLDEIDYFEVPDKQACSLKSNPYLVLIRSGTNPPCSFIEDFRVISYRFLLCTYILYLIGKIITFFANRVKGNNLKSCRQILVREGFKQSDLRP